jgi:uncharacterized protein
VTPLLDVNLLVALTWPNHVHHAVAHRWFQRIHKTGWATCPLTQTGFVRVSSNRQALPDAVTPRNAVLLLRELVALPGHVFWQDDISIARSEAFALNRLAGHRQITDAHLLALAMRHGGRLATLDRHLLGLVPDRVRARDAVVLVQEAG